MTREEADKIKNIPNVFILGKGRSGTTLLQSLLNAHPNIVAPPESKFVVLHGARFGKIKKWNETDVHEFVAALFSEFFFFYTWKQDRKQLTDFLLSAIDYLDYPLACKMVYYAARGNKNEVKLISDKNPLYAVFIPQIRKVFPDAKFIHLVRDPRDNVLSTIKAYGGGNPFFISWQWLIHNAIIEDDKKKAPDQYFSLLYENMVKDIEGTMKELCSFLKIPYNESMKEINRTELKDTYSSNADEFLKNKKSMLKPINLSNIDKWRSEMKPADIEIVERITARFAKENYGYEMTTDYRKNGAPEFKIFRWRIIYSIWLPFTRQRYKSNMMNRIYSKVKKKVKGDKMPVWENIIE